MSSSETAPMPQEPQPMPEKSHKFSKQAIAELNEIVTHYPEKRAAMLPALWIAQREYGGYLPPEAMKEVGERLGRPPGRVGGVAALLTQVKFPPPGPPPLRGCSASSRPRLFGV